MQKKKKYLVLLTLGVILVLYCNCDSLPLELKKIVRKGIHNIHDNLTGNLS